MNFNNKRDNSEYNDDKNVKINQSYEVESKSKKKINKKIVILIQK